MKIIAALFIGIVLSCSTGETVTYTASTPAGKIVRSFLNISPTDSINFIKWHLTLSGEKFKLNCNYGIGKPNTNGFINDGKQIQVEGNYSRQGKYLILLNGTQFLKFAVLNNNLLHPLNEKDDLIGGTSGWSYTLTKIDGRTNEPLNFYLPVSPIKDSAIYGGRTPCAIQGLTVPSTCRRLKWKIVLYTDPVTHHPTTYKLYGTLWENRRSLTGEWMIVNSENGVPVFQLNDESGKKFLLLARPSENILLFTNHQMEALTGDDDFSYTLNRSK